MAPPPGRVAVLSGHGAREATISSQQYLPTQAQDTPSQDTSTHLADTIASDLQDLVGNAAVAESLGLNQASNDLLHLPFMDLLSGEPTEAEQNALDAQNELAAKLVVGEGSGVQDGRAVVSQAEYDRMLQTYTQIRSGDSHLKISPMGMDEAGEAEFRAGALDTLTTMMQTDAGRQLLDNLANQDDRDPMDRRDIILSNGLASYEEAHGQDRLIGNRCIPRDEQSASIEGMGTGSAVFWANQDRDLTDSSGKTMHMPKDAVMFHELTHALHNLRGTRDADPVEAGDGVASDTGRTLREEHQTIGIGAYEGEYLSENTYRAQRRAMGSDLPDAERRALEEAYRHRDEWFLQGGSRGPLTDTRGKQKYGEGGWPVKG